MSRQRGEAYCSPDGTFWGLETCPLTFTTAYTHFCLDYGRIIYFTL